MSYPANLLEHCIVTNSQFRMRFVCRLRYAKKRNSASLLLHSFHCFQEISSCHLRSGSNGFIYLDKIDTVLGWKKERIGWLNGKNNGKSTCSQIDCPTTSFLRFRQTLKDWMGMDKVFILCGLSRNVVRWRKRESDFSSTMHEISWADNDETKATWLEVNMDIDSCLRRKYDEVFSGVKQKWFFV